MTEVDDATPSLISNQEIVVAADKIKDKKKKAAFLFRALCNREKFPRRTVFFQRFFRIKDKSAKIIPLVGNYAQRKLESIILRMERQKLPVRVIILKCRQSGFSTYVEAVIGEAMLRRDNIRAKIMGDDEDTAEKILWMFRRFYDNIPEDIRPPYQSMRDNRIRLERPFYSSVDIGSSKGKPIHGDTIQYLHLTELSRWKPNTVDEHLKGLLQNVPYEANTYVFEESTAFGASGRFYDDWNRAVEGESGYKPMFVAWFDHENYRMPCPELLRKKIEATLDDEEEWLLTQIAPQPRLAPDGKRLVYSMEPLSYEQLAWRRFKLNGECGGNLDDLHEQYPSTPDEAFLSSGTNYFSGASIALAKERMDRSIWRGDVLDLDYDAEKAMMKVRDLIYQPSPFKVNDVNEQVDHRRALHEESLRELYDGTNVDVDRDDW